MRPVSFHHCEDTQIKSSLSHILKQAVMSSEQRSSDHLRSYVLTADLWQYRPIISVPENEQSRASESKLKSDNVKKIVECLLLIPGSD